jgi:uncharacterized protein (TIGR03032 family)
MAPSQILRDLLGTRALHVSSHSDNRVLTLKDYVWSIKGLTTPRGMAFGPDTLAVVAKDGIHWFSNINGTESAIFPVIDPASHEMTIQADGSVIVCSPASSSLVRYNIQTGSSTLWTVPGVDVGTTDARSWVNGVCLENDMPAYVTTLGIGNAPDMWRIEAAASRGALIDARTNEIVLQNLFFPHTPTLVGTTVYFLNSGHGQVCKWTPGDMDYTVIADLGGWTRGLHQLDSTHFAVGVSQGRVTAFPNLTTDPLAQPGIAIVDITTGARVGFEPLDVQEIFDIEIGSAVLL